MIEWPVPEIRSQSSPAVLYPETCRGEHLRELERTQFLPAAEIRELQPVGCAFCSTSP